MSFSKEISDFQRYGTYSYEYDEVGNVVFDSSSNDFSHVYLALPLSDFVYNNTKINSFYNPEFVEFTPPTRSEYVSPEVEKIQTELNNTLAQNNEMAKQLDALIAENESNFSSAEKLASKQVIIELRKALDQGRVDSDFSEDFPYTPIKKTTNITEDTTSK